MFSQVTVSYLRSYEAFMINQNLSITTVGINVRMLRAIFNEADARKIISKPDCYPFGRRKYQIPHSRKIKKALTLEEISKIYYYNPVREEEALARDLWIFCYLGNGMNPKDLLNLKFKNLNGEFLTFNRIKTQLTSRSNPMPVTVYVNEDMQNIIERRGNKPDDINNYIFPFLHDGQTLLESYFAVVKHSRFINHWMGKIGQKLEIKIKLTSIVSRHSFSTRLKRSGVSTEFIQESLGHSDKRTTEHYLDGFENEVKKEYAAKLLEFKK
jgi:integrase/recombinase XerD